MRSEIEPLSIQIQFTAEDVFGPDSKWQKIATWSPCLEIDHIISRLSLIGNILQGHYQSGSLVNNQAEAEKFTASMNIKLYPISNGCYKKTATDQEIRESLQLLKADADQLYNMTK